MCTGKGQVSSVVRVLGIAGVIGAGCNGDINMLCGY